ncbi:PREDICTED: kinesin-like protein KIF26A [Chrysochloris asiatica]|uniref:Kinesin-like protein KIF26A n=1 Tax=Chrysochloris asiatica TaxID=185453 RepID=A0A9B0T3Q5_CHRAS|nr:PREDICTED: kinesin-like protein KIF26A [Chrysochloris asiatica]
MGGRGAPLCTAQPGVAEGGRTREPLPLLEVPPLKRLPPGGPDQDPCGGRPAPEGAGAGAEQGHSVGGGGWCRHCHTKLAELKRQAWKLVSGPGTALRDPRLSALLLETLPGPGPLLPCCPEAERHCDVCTTHLNQLTRDALQLPQGPAHQEEPDTPRGGPAGMTSPRDVPGPVGPAGRTAGRAGPDRRKAPAWPPGPSVQVSVSPAGPGGTLSTVTIQAQQCLEGMWSVSGVNSFLPPTCLAEAAVAAVAVAESVRDGPPSMRPDGLSQAWGLAGTCTTALVTPAPTVVGSAGPSAAASFFIRAAQKLSLASKRKKAPPPPPPAPAARTASAYPTDFSGVLQLWPPPIPPCLLRVAKAKDTPCSTGKVRVTLRIWSSKGTQRSAESMSFLKVDPRKKQVTLYDPAAGPPGSAGPRRAATAAVPRLFAFDAVFPQDSEQAEVCSGTVADVLQAVVSGADGCIFSFGHSSLGKSYTMIGKDSSPQSLGVVPCAISWLFRLIHEHKERTGTRFSVRVSAVEVCGRDQSLHDLLADLASGSLQDTQSPGVYLREDPVCGAQLQNQSELRAPTAERAAFYLDAALAARSSSRPGCSEDARRSSHLLFTLHVYQYCMPKCGRGGMSGGRSRLHLIDLGSCEPLAPSRGMEPPGAPLCLSLSALGSVILALVNGAKHVPYREQRLTMLLRESLATTNCHTTMIVHISDAPARHAETLSTVQLAARIHRLRRKKAKYASSSSGGESSCEEGRVRRPPAPRPCPQRTTALDSARRTPGDPECSSSSDQSCDTVIYVGPGGAALSDRELTDNEAPPDFVPIIPALGRRRPSEGPRDADCDHFRCSTFAELQERLDFIDGNEGPSVPAASPARAVRKPPELAAPRKATGTLLTACMPLGSPSPDPLGITPDTSRAGVQGEQKKDSGPWPELSSLASPLPPWREESGPGDPGTTVRTPPAGCPRLPARGRCLDRGLLTTTVTLQQPVELNGEDELVFTVVEELPLGSLAHPRPASLSSFGSNCSLQALASGSRPVSIISSINDEFDAYTSQAADGPGGHLDTSQAADGPGRHPDEVWVGSDSSHGSSISSWLSEVSVCVADSPVLQPSFRASPDSMAGSGLRGPSSQEGSPEQGRSDSPVQVPGGGELVPEASRELCGPPPAQTIHSSLPRKLRTTSATREGGPCLGQSSPEPEGLSQDPWLLRADEADVIPVALTLAQGPSWPPEAQALPACAQRVVDGCEMASRPVRRPEARIPPLRRGATTLGVTTPVASCGDTLAASPGSLRAASSKKGTSPKGGPLPRPGGMVPPTPPVRKSSLEPKSSPPLAPALAVGLSRAAAAAAFRGEEEARPPPRTTSSLKVRTGKAEAVHRPPGPVLLERPEGLSQVSSRVREASGRPGRAVPRLGTPSASPMPGPCRGSPAKGLGTPKPPVAGGKGRSLVAGGARALSTSVRTPSGPAVSPRAASRVAPNVGAKAGRGTVMGTKQALRAAHSRVHELAAGGVPVHSSPSWGVADSDSGNDSGVQVGEERPPAGPALPSPYSKVTAPRRPQRYSSGHGSDNSSVLSGELPPAMGRTALFYHSGGSSGYESVMRDSEAPDSMSESGAASPGARSRSLRSPKKRSTGLQRRRLIPAPLPDATALGRKPSLPGQWVDLPPPLAGALKEPFEIKVYEIDDVQRLQRHRAACREDSPEGLASAGVRLRLAERRLQRLREVQARRDRLCEELAETQGRLMVEPGRWLDQFEVDPQLEPESVEYLKALEQATAALEQCVNLCKAHVMMVTCFDVSASASAPGLQEVDV